MEFQYPLIFHNKEEHINHVKKYSEFYEDILNVRRPNKRRVDIVSPWEGKNFEDELCYQLNRIVLLKSNGIKAEKTKGPRCCDIVLSVPSLGRVAIEAKNKSSIGKQDVTRFNRDILDPKNNFIGGIFWSHKGKIPGIEIDENNFKIENKMLYLRDFNIEDAIRCIHVYVLYLKETKSALVKNHGDVIGKMIAMWKRNFVAYKELKKNVKQLDEFLKTDIIEIEKMCSGIVEFTEQKDLKRELERDLYLVPKSDLKSCIQHDPYGKTPSSNSSSTSKRVKIPPTRPAKRYHFSSGDSD